MALKSIFYKIQEFQDAGIRIKSDWERLRENKQVQNGHKRGRAG